MSIVGPRPERPQIAEEYEKAMPEFYLRLQVKAGLTGYAQVYGKYNTTPYDKLLMDLMYISHANILDESIATLLSRHHEIMAVDIIPEKVELINQRKSPIQDNTSKNI